MTKCKHYFCEHCALRQYQKSKLCFVCEEPTGGTFNIAHDIIKKFKEKAARALAMEEGEELDPAFKAFLQPKSKKDGMVAQGSTGWVIPSGGYNLL